MNTHIFKTAVIDYYVSHRYIEPVTHPQSFPCQGKEVCSLPLAMEGSIIPCHLQERKTL